MRHEILDAPDFGLLELTLGAGEKVVAESGAMVAMGPSVSVETKMRGGFLAAAKRKLLGGESLFQNTFTAREGEQKLYLAPAVEGDVRVRELARGEAFFLQSGNYLAHVGDGLVLDTQWGGVRSFFGGIGFFMLKVVGPGTLFYASYGAIHEVEVSAGGYTCDTGHIVGFSDGLEYRVRPFAGFKGLFFSGEGLVCDFEGRGALFVQTRKAPALAGFLHPFRRVQQRGGN
jgi:uncharacterized protein (TIGR00266 family)